MNLAPSDLPRLAGAASLSKPGFDIILAVSGARQTALPTAGLLRARAVRKSRVDAASARRAMLCGTIAADGDLTQKPVRFFDLSDEVNSLSENMNHLFTRGFQRMLKPLHIDGSSPDAPRSGDEDME